MRKYLFLVFLTVQSLAQAAEFVSSAESGTVVFKAAALGLKFEGRGPGPIGTIQTGDSPSGELVFALDAIDTGIGLRNTHMKENYLETKKYPNSKLTITKINGFDQSKTTQENNFEGYLTVRDIQKPITNGHVKLEKKEDSYFVEAIFDTKISDFSMPIPKYAGVALKDSIQVEARLLFKRQSISQKSK